MSDKRTWPERMIPHTYASTVGAALGCLTGIWLFAILHGRAGALPELTVGGFLAGIIVGPILRRFFAPESQTRTTSSAAETAASFTRAATLAKTLFHYTYATTLGAALGCISGIATFALTHARPLAFLTVGGFFLGSLAAIVIVAAFPTLSAPLGDLPVPEPKLNPPGEQETYAPA